MVTLAVCLARLPFKGGRGGRKDQLMDDGGKFFAGYDECAVVDSGVG